jgi:hypothetical protein
MAKTSTVTAVFRNRFDATAAYDYVMGKGYTRDEVNVMMSNSTREAFQTEGRQDVGSMATEPPRRSSARLSAPSIGPPGRASSTRTTPRARSRA